MEAKDITGLIDELLKKLDLDLTSEVTMDGDVVLVNLNGRDARYLEQGTDNRVGAFITIIKLMAKQRYDAEPKLVIDLNNQRKQRLENIAQMARKTAEMVRLRGGEEELRPMSPAERRAVHMEIKKMDGIRTESRGEEPHRRIVIMPSQSEES